jgi:nitroreductase
MDIEDFDQRNMLLDEIISERRTYRKFKQEFPPENNIKNIINAGLHAPFAAAAVGD